jgi:putative hydrolase of the HAD superfamily
VNFKLIIFDLDGTLYPRDSGLFSEIGRRIRLWLCERMELSWEEATARQRDYFLRYGTTLGGLIVEHDVDAHDYLSFVHDVPVAEYPDPDPALAAMLDDIPLRKAVYTNAPSEYGWRVLRVLGVSDRFEQLIGIEEVGLRNKPYPDALEQALELLGAQGTECIMVEDSVRNLGPAKALGLTTVLVDAADASGLSGHAACQGLGETHGTSVDFVVGSVLDVGRVVSHLLCQTQRGGDT